MSIPSENTIPFGPKENVSFSLKDTAFYKLFNELNENSRMSIFKHIEWVLVNAHESILVPDAAQRLHKLLNQIKQQSDTDAVKTHELREGEIFNLSSIKQKAAIWIELTVW